jgi:hypothetical protein
MKKIILALCLLQGLGYAQTPCPPYGSAKPGSMQYVLNQKKNRTDIPESYKSVTINEWLAMPEDSTGDGMAYHLTGGYVIKVKMTEPESCNCNSKTERDFEIILVPSMADAKNFSKYVVVEFTPRIMKLLKWNASDLNKLLNHSVDFYGRKFTDLEEKSLSLKSTPGNINGKRGTIVELHPVTKWEVKK